MSSPLTAENAAALVAADDLAGLAVHDAEDLLAGHVVGVLTEADTGLIRFIDVQLESDARHVLVPVGHSRLEQVVDRTRIRLRAAKLHDLEHVPAYDANTALTTGYAREIAAEYGRFFRGDFYYAHPAYDHRGVFAGPHPIARTAPTAGPDTRELMPLRDSDFRIVAGESDVHGWAVVGSDGGAVGAVEDLLIDPNAERVRYLVIIATTGQRHALPIGYVELRETEEQIIVPGLTAVDVAALPALVGSLSRADEEALLDRIERALDARNPFLRVDFSEREIATQE